MAALLDCHVVDSEAEPAFDAITDLAAQICDTPIALVSLVDAERQWFKSAKGMGAVRQTERGVSFCAHAINDDVPMEIGDATQDPRFADNRLVVGDLGLRFYCGFPLLTRKDRLALGTLCVNDHFARKLTLEQHWAMRQLAVVTTALIELRRAP